MSDQSRLQANNNKIDEIKTLVNNLPEYQDLEPIYGITNYTISSKIISPEASNPYIYKYAKLGPYVAVQFASRTTYSSYGMTSSNLYLYKLESNGSLTLLNNTKYFYARNNLTIIGYDDNYVYLYMYNWNGGTAPTYFPLSKFNLSTMAYESDVQVNLATGQTNLFSISNNVFYAYGSDGSYAYQLNPSTATATKLGNRMPGNYLSNTSFISVSGGSTWTTKFYYNRNNFTEVVAKAFPTSTTQQFCCCLTADENKLIFDGNIYRTNSNLDLVELLNENVVSKSTSCYRINNKYYLSDNKLMTLNDTTNTFTIELEATNFALKYNELFVLSANSTELSCVTFNTGETVIGFRYNGLPYTYNNPAVVNTENILQGYQTYNDSLAPVIGTMPNNGALNYTPSTSQQIIPAGYTSGGTIAAVTSSIDSDIVAGNIKKDVEILGVTGTLEEGIDTSDATATADDILEGKTAYVNGVKLTGTMENLSNTITEQENLIANLYSLVNTKINGTSSGPFVVPDGMKFAYSNITNLPEIDTSVVTDMNIMFWQCWNLVDIPNLNTTNVTNMSGMFLNCRNILNISNFDMSNVIDVSNMFSGCLNLTNLPALNTINIINAKYMCQNCFGLVEVENLNTSNVIIAAYAFSECWNLVNIPLLNMDNVNNIEGIFYNCRNLSVDSYANIANSLPLAVNLTNQYVSNLGLDVRNFVDAQVIILNNKGYIDAIPKANTKGTTYNITYTI